MPPNCYMAQITTDQAGKVFSWHARDRSTDAHLQAMVWDRSTGKTYTFPKKSGYTLDESHVDGGGKYVIITYSNHMTAMWDFRAGTSDWFTMSSPNDDTGGHFAFGSDFMVNSDQY